MHIALAATGYESATGHESLRLPWLPRGTSLSDCPGCHESLGRGIKHTNFARQRTEPSVNKTLDAGRGERFICRVAI